MVSIAPTLDMVLIAADKEVATAKVNPPEMLASMMIKPDRPIEHPRQLRSRGL